MPNRGSWVAVVIVAVVFALTTIALSALVIACAVVGCGFLSGTTCSRPLTETEKCPVNSAVTSDTIDSWANGTCKTVKSDAGLERKLKLSFYKNLFQNVTDMLNKYGCRDVRCSGKHCKQHQERCTKNTTTPYTKQPQTTPKYTPFSGSGASGSRPRRGIKNDGSPPCRR